MKTEEVDTKNAELVELDNIQLIQFLYSGQMILKTNSGEKLEIRTPDYYKKREGSLTQLDQQLQANKKERAVMKARTFYTSLRDTIGDLI